MSAEHARNEAVPPDPEASAATGATPDAQKLRDPLADVDLYCLQCGYNLRGLSGDPRRCPECAFDNPVGDIRLPARIIRAQLRRMETAPTIAVGAVLAVLPFLLPAILILSEPFLRGDALSALGFLAVPVGAASIAWIASLVVFRNSCRAKPGWVGAFRAYHVAGLGLALLVLLPFILMVTVLTLDLFERASSRAMKLGLQISLGVAIAVSLASLFILAPRLHRRLKAQLEPLQREVAVEIARQRARKAMASPSRRRGSL